MRSAQRDVHAEGTSVKVTVRGTAVLAVVGFIGLLAARYSVHRLDDAMRVHPEWWPPALQVREQTNQSASFFKWIADPELGFVLPPNLQQTITTSDFTFVRVTDAFGFPNGRSWPAHADIVFTGDSLLLGEGVGVDKTFVNLADESLKDQTIANLGNPGAGLERQRLFFHRYGVALTPSLVVAALYAASDLGNDRAWYAWRKDPLGMEYNEFRLGYGRRTNPPEGELARRFENRPLYSWVRSVVEPHLWGARRIRHRLRMPDGQEIYFDRKVVKAAKGVLAPDDADLVALSASLDRFRGQVTAQGAVFAVMLIPSKEEIFAIEQPPPQGAPIARIRSLLDTKGIPYLDLYPVLAVSAEHATPYFQRDIHLNLYGNQVVAEAFTHWYQGALARDIARITQARSGSLRPLK